MKVILKNSGLVFQASAAPVNIPISESDISNAFINSQGEWNAAGKGVMVDVTSYRGKEVVVEYAANAPSAVKYIAFLTSLTAGTNGAVSTFCTGYSSRVVAGTYTIPEDCVGLLVLSALPSAPSTIYLPTINVYA